MEIIPYPNPYDRELDISPLARSLLLRVNAYRREQNDPWKATVCAISENLAPQITKNDLDYLSEQYIRVLLIDLFGNWVKYLDKPLPGKRNPALKQKMDAFIDEHFSGEIESQGHGVTRRPNKRLSTRYTMLGDYDGILRKAHTEKEINI